MTVLADVANEGAVLVGGAGYRFAPGETRKGCELSASRFPEVYGHPDLKALVKRASGPQEIPRGSEQVGHRGAG